VNPVSSSEQAPEGGLDSAEEILGGFPRHLTRDLISADELDRPGRSLLGTWLMGAGLALFALALPQAALVGRGPASLAAWCEGELFSGGVTWSLFVRGLSECLDWRWEPAALLLSALCYGATLPALASLGRLLGVSRGSALSVAALVLFSPLAWVAATTPGPEALALLMGVLLLRALWQSREVPPNGLHLVLVALLFVAAVGASSGLLFTLPAVVLGLFGGPPELVSSRRGSVLKVIAALASLALCILLFEFLPAEAPALGGYCDPAQLSLLKTLALFGGSLALTLLGLAALVALRRGESEQAPPVWLALWALLPLAAALLFSAGPSLSVLHLLPLAALGGLDLVGRNEDSLAAWVRPACVLGALLPLFLALKWISNHDPEGAWRARAQAVLEPDDLVLVRRAEHAYLLSERWNIEVLEVTGDALASLVRTAQSEGRRVVLDTLAGPPAGLSQSPARIEDL